MLFLAEEEGKTDDEDVLFHPLFSRSELKRFDSAVVPFLIY